MPRSQKRHNLIYYSGWLTVWLSLAGAVASLSMLYQTEVSRGDAVFGEWVEMKAPPYNTEIFELSAIGVTQNSRVVSTQFDYTGSTITFYRGDAQHEYQVVNRDKSLIRRITPAPRGVYFAKYGTEAYIERTTEPEPSTRGPIQFRTIN
ncbi:DUF2850 domain-containing protein [Vibrio ulleungensis]|uniref:DUF2850 domain-containing protein n=1 Tax=Vibrio ulleungensis TaxID=2807619 RepID=A0ABS2HM98_9VIBR|nr:DUF2850 domain-containing protein [Vibrio ulleungensis]MBM7037002.1 DUF2850 domain-containing protein [Vibrio ulleungensis]